MKSLKALCIIVTIVAILALTILQSFAAAKTVIPPNSTNVAASSKSNLYDKSILQNKLSSSKLLKNSEAVNTTT